MPRGRKKKKNTHKGGLSQPLTVKYKKCSPTLRPPLAKKYKPQGSHKS